MKKIILSLVGVVGITAGSWGQSLPTNAGSPIVLSGLGAFDGSYEYSWGPQEMTDYYGYPAGSLRYGYSIPNTYTMVYIMVPPGESPRIQNLSVNNGPPTWGTPHSVSTYYDGSFVQNYGGPTGDGLLFNTFTNFSATYEGGGFGPGYASSGGGGSGSVYFTQASELTKGLTFQNGQWTPTQQ